MNLPEKKQHLLAWSLIIFLLLVGLLLLVNLRNRQLLTRQAAAPGADAVISLVPSSTNININQEFTVDVKVQSDSHPIYGSDVIIEFDHTKLQVTSVEPVGTNGCSDGEGVVIAPVKSETDTNCQLKDSNTDGIFDQITAANSSGKLEFGAVIFDWVGAANNPDYTPTPLTPGLEHTIARVRFTGISQGTGTINIVPRENDTGSFCRTALNCGTTDVNIAAVSSDGTVGDILQTVNANLSITIGNTTAPTATPTPIEGGLISNIQSNSIDPSDQYRKDIISQGSLQYIDRSNFTYTDVPTSLVGNEYILTANDDKSVTDSSFLSFTLSQSATVYVAHDDRITTKPSWLATFTDTGDNLVSGAGTFSLYQKSFNSGTVTLGGNEGSGSYSMYTVVAVPGTSNCDSRIADLDTLYPMGSLGTKDQNIDFFEVSLYINNYNCVFDSGDTNACDLRIPSTADGAQSGSPNGNIDFGEVSLAINNYNCNPNN